MEFDWFILTSKQLQLYFKCGQGIIVETTELEIRSINFYGRNHRLIKIINNDFPVVVIKYCS